MANSNPSKDGFFRWTAEIQVHETWVADGFNLTNERLQAMLERELGFAYSTELRAKVLSSPKEEAINKAQGYES